MLNFPCVLIVEEQNNMALKTFLLIFFQVVHVL